MHLNIITLGLYNKYYFRLIIEVFLYYDTIILDAIYVLLNAAILHT